MFFPHQAPAACASPWLCAALLVTVFTGCARHEFRPGPDHPANPSVSSPRVPRANVFAKSLWSEEELAAVPAMSHGDHTGHAGHEGHGQLDLSVGVDPVISNLIERPTGEGSGAETRPLAESSQPPADARAQVRDANNVPPEHKLRGEQPPAGVGIIYTCPMHPEIRKPGPGSCPICHMDLVPEVEPGKRDFTAEKYAHGHH